MIVVGLTGGIGSGKSSVSALLAERGAVVIDGDAIVRELQQPGQPVLAAMVERFGDGILRPDGTLDRQGVADIVFHDAAALADLNAIVHPAVGEEILRRLAAASAEEPDSACRSAGEAAGSHAETGAGRVVVLDVPLLVESGRYDTAGLLVVDVEPDVAVARLVAHRGFTEADARARMANQISREDRLAKADHVIDNSATLTDLATEVDRAWRWIEALVERT